MTDPAVWPRVGDVAAEFQRVGIDTRATLTTVTKVTDARVTVATGRVYMAGTSGKYGGLRQHREHVCELLPAGVPLVVNCLARTEAGSLRYAIDKALKESVTDVTAFFAKLDEIDQLTAAARAAVNNLTEKD